MILKFKLNIKNMQDLSKRNTKHKHKLFSKVKYLLIWKVLIAVSTSPIYIYNEFISDITNVIQLTEQSSVGKSVLQLN